MDDKILITGSGSGLGKYLKQEFSRSIGYNRSSNWDEIEKNQPFDTIVHCAADSRFSFSSNQVADFFESNIGLTQKLLNLKFKNFIFISTIDIYPNPAPLSEDQYFELQSPKSMYGFSKLCSENLVRNVTPKHLILRPSSLLGPYMKRNTFIKIHEDKMVSLSLKGSSMYNFVLYSDISTFIKVSMSKNISGTFNITANASIALNELVPNQNNVTYGSFEYIAPSISSAKAYSAVPELNKSSLENVMIFRNQMWPGHPFDSEKITNL